MPFRRLRPRFFIFRLMIVAAFLGLLLAMWAEGVHLSRRLGLYRNSAKAHATSTSGLDVQAEAAEWAGQERYLRLSIPAHANRTDLHPGGRSRIPPEPK